MSEEPAQPKRRPTQRKSKSRGNGDGSIYQRSDGLWCAAIRDESGQRKYLYSKSRAAVSRRLAEAMSNLHRGLPAIHRQQTVGAWLDYWLENIVRQEREPTTYESYEVSVRHHMRPFLGSKTLHKLQVEDVERWLRQLEKQGRGVRTRQFALTRLRTALKTALKRGHVARDVAELVDMPPSTQRKLAPPTTEDLHRLLDVIRGDRLEALVILALATGLRRGELLGLRWEDVDLEQQSLTVRARVSRVHGVGSLVREGAKTQAGQRRAFRSPGTSRWFDVLGRVGREVAPLDGHAERRVQPEECGLAGPQADTGAFEPVTSRQRSTSSVRSVAATLRLPSPTC